ncbi:hypothetical protein PAXINDRAFT_16983 [Paxillus involutus ATCC 200175]|uniref:Uncharacterized protein n=1 Tax=Paxillus involutus ATCC 200175 TaxID=664439 RepID=A0A0C9TS01_PAXIN|nr:hypothetical protein PAXINDRAFT_16983 [Paxillus involutus ATCC 200175]
MPHPPNSTCQMAVEEATGTLNPNANGAGTAMPVGTSNGLPNESNENEEGKGRMEEEKGEDVHHAYVVPSPTPQPTQLRTTPPKRMPYDRRSNGRHRGSNERHHDSKPVKAGQLRGQVA